MLDVLRDELGLTGSKEGCGSGDCGACTIICDGKIVCSCLMLGVEAEGKTITTIEGIAAGRQAASGAAEIPRARGAAMRLLHAGLHRRGQGAARREPEPDRGRGPLLAGRQSVPLHRLRQDRPRRAGRRRGDARRAASSSTRRRNTLSRTAGEGANRAWRARARSGSAPSPASLRSAPSPALRERDMHLWR